MTNRSADAVIIGSGLNSLVCAYSLVQNGWSVISRVQPPVDEPATQSVFGLMRSGLAHQSFLGP